MDKREKALQKRANKLAEKTYRHFIPAQLEKKLREVPDGFIHYTSSMRDAVGVSLHVYGDRTGGVRRFDALAVRLPETRPWFTSDRYRSLPDDHALKQVARDIRDDFASFVQDREVLRRETSSVLKQCGTLDKLMKVCPELEPFTKELKAPVPAVLRAEKLGKMIAEVVASDG